MHRRLIRSVALSLATLVAALAAGGAPVGAQPAGFADYAGALQILSEQWNPQGFKSEYNQPTIVKYMLDNAWTQSRDDSCTNLKQSLGKPDAVIKGQTLYDIVCSMGQTGTLRIKNELAARGGDVQLEYYVSGNYLEFTSTQPTAAGKWADPRMSVSYDLDLISKIGVGSAPGVSVSSAVAYVRNAHIDSHGVIADVVLDFVKVLSAALGQNFQAMAESQINSQKVDLTGLLRNRIGPVNAILQGFASNGYTEMYGKMNGGTLGLYLVGKTYAVATTGRGTISGAIRWDKASGHPQDAMTGCQALKITATTPAGYAESGRIIPPLAAVGTVQMGPVSTQVGTQYECDYRIANVPLEEPITIQISAAHPWVNASNVPVMPVAQQSGWSGTITLHDGVAAVRDTNVHTAVGPAATTAAPSNYPPANRPSAATVAPTAIATGNQARTNPTGSLSVSNIDFTVLLAQPPR